ncbi:nucleotide sugar dehydrogenase [Thermicanus aegyptius]|uniref:nucleotide sugar dehydrogenase n=1 Tax=Thermicanus aegyptius TaxID=94009 RepID=UPI00048CBFE7|nr:nucleotide sugar dehydrogenase [Thermicanus aegyptius]
MNQLHVGVIGLGFVGLPLSLSYAMKGAKVIGVDVLPRLVEELNQGISYHQEYDEGKPLAEILREELAKGNFRATTDYREAANEVNHYIVTVGIPVRNGDPDLSYLISAAESLSQVLKKGDLVVLRSTVVPGTTEEIFLPILEKSGLKAGVDFDLAYSSERIAEGRAFEEFRTMPLAVGGVTEASALRAKEFLSFVTEAEITLSSIKIVETAKVIENVQRDVNIAMVQEFARFAEGMGINTAELIRVANTHKRVNLLVPGPGVGGYCLPNAYYYLQPKAAEMGLRLGLLEMARQINDAVPGVLVTMMEEGLKKRGKGIREAKIAVLGLAMKDYSNDDRISPCHQVVSLLISKGAIVKAYDPAVPSRYPFKVDTLEEAADGADGLFFLAMQKAFEGIRWQELLGRMSENAVLVDAKNRIPYDLKAEVIRI